VRFDRKAYPLVEIGSQCWFKENLAADNYRNGDAIPGVQTGAPWILTPFGAQSGYNDAATLAIYGRLYNFYAVGDPRGLCPAGFHVPSIEEWSVFVNSFGGDDAAGAALKSSPTDVPAWDGTNSSSFSALPGGFLDDYNGFFNDLGDYGYRWSSESGSSSSAYSYRLISGYSTVRQHLLGLHYGFSVRCVRD